MNTVQCFGLLLALCDAPVQHLAGDSKRHSLVEAAPGQRANDAAQVLVVLGAVYRSRFDLPRGLLRNRARGVLLVFVGDLLQGCGAVRSPNALVAQLHIQRAGGLAATGGALAHPLVGELRVVDKAGAGKIVEDFVYKLRLELGLDQPLA